LITAKLINIAQSWKKQSAVSSLFQAAGNLFGLRPFLSTTAPIRVIRVNSRLNIFAWGFFLPPW
jgi:hypothetical protein